MNEYKGLNRSKVQKMLVWDNNEKEANDRYVLFINIDGSCIAIDMNNEEHFFNKNTFGMIFWKHCKSMQTLRQMTREEAMNFIATHPKKAFMRVRFQGSEWKFPEYYNYNENILDYEYAFYVSENGEYPEPQQFMIEDKS